jgi:hypothetical protein
MMMMMMIMNVRKMNKNDTKENVNGFGGLIPKFAGSHPAEAVGFLGRKISQHVFLRRGSKAAGPMS